MERITTSKLPKVEKAPGVCPHCGRADCQAFLRSKEKRVKPTTHTDRIGVVLQNELNSIKGELNRTIIIWGRVFPNGAEHPRLAEVIYQGEPFAGAYLEASRSLGEALDRAATLPPRFTLPPGLTRQDHYRGKTISQAGIGFRSPSPRDISNLPLPLDNEGIGKIDSLMRSIRIGPFQYGDSRAAYLLEVMPIQPLARPELKLTVPRGLQPLNDRMLAYYDYYMGFIIVPDLDYEQETKGLIRMAWAGGRTMEALTCYIPARLGITPSSTFKLYQEKNSLSEGSLSGRRFHKVFGRGIEQAYRKGALPPHLQRYQHLDKEVDRRAAEALEFKYKSKDRSWGNESEDDAIGTLRRLARYRAGLRSEVLRSPDKYLRVSIDPEGVIRDILIASQNQQTLMMIVEIADGSHITLEANNSSRLFGIPPQLRRAYPHIEDLIIRDVVAPVLDWAKPRFPHIEPGLQTTRVLTVTMQELPDAQVYKGSLSVTPEQVVIKPPKRKTFRTAIEKAVIREPTLPQPAQERRKLRRIQVSRAQIEDLLPRNTSPDVVDRVMRAVREFQYGERGAKALKDFDVESIRVGEYRVILQKQDNGVYTLQEAGHRREVYRDYT